jgi:hypothetical protein
VGLETLPQAVTDTRKTIPAARKALSVIKVDLAQAAGVPNHTSNRLPTCAAVRRPQVVSRHRL